MIIQQVVIQNDGKPISSFAEMMSPDDAARYNQYWDDISKGLDTNTRIKLNQWNYRPDADLYLKYKDVYDNPKYYDQITGKINWPPNNGAVEGTEEVINLGEGITFGRIGSDKGTFVAPPNTSLDKLSLSPETDVSKYTEYVVVKPISGVEKATIAPWFDKIGGGSQFKLPMTINDLIKNGYIVPK